MPHSHCHVIVPPALVCMPPTSRVACFFYATHFSMIEPLHARSERPPRASHARRTAAGRPRARRVDGTRRPLPHTRGGSQSRRGASALGSVSVAFTNHGICVAYIAGISAGVSSIPFDDARRKVFVSPQVAGGARSRCVRGARAAGSDRRARGTAGTARRSTCSTASH